MIFFMPWAPLHAVTECCVNAGMFGALLNRLQSRGVERTTAIKLRHTYTQGPNILQHSGLSDFLPYPDVSLL